MANNTDKLTVWMGLKLAQLTEVVCTIVIFVLTSNSALSKIFYQFYFIFTEFEKSSHHSQHLDYSGD